VLAVVRHVATGEVVLVERDDPGVEVKPIAGAGAEPLLLPHQVALARLVADHYWVPLIECIRAMLPPRVRATGSAGSGASTRQRRRSRLLELATATVAASPAVELTGEQKAALDAIEAGSSTLLHGVIASGKTEIYLAAAQRALDQGLRVLLLVPEISLTAARGACAIAAPGAGGDPPDPADRAGAGAAVVEGQEGRGRRGPGQPFGGLRAHPAARPDLPR